MTDLRERLEAFCEGFDQATSPLGIDEVVDERVGGEAVRVIQPRFPARRPLPGWAIAAITAVVVTAVASAAFMLARSSDPAPFVDDDTIPDTTAPILVDAGGGFDAAAELIGDDWPYRGYPEQLGDGTWVVFGNDRGEADDEVVWILGETGTWVPHEVTEFGGVTVPWDRTYVHVGLLWAWIGGTSPPEVWNSADGITWRQTELNGWNGRNHPALQPWRFARAGDTILMGSGDDGMAYVSSDAGRSYEAITPFPGTIFHLWHTGDEFRAIVAVGVDALTLWRSGDGMEWEQIGPVRGLEDADLDWTPALSVSLDALLIGDLYNGECEGDVYRSVDGGSTWQALGIVEWLTDGFPSFLRRSCRSVASADGEWMLVTAGSAWGPPRAGVWGSHNGVDWYRLESSSVGLFYEGGSYPVVDTDLAPPPEP